MPASWEIKAIRDNRILLAIITLTTTVSLQFAKNLRVLQLPPGSDFTEVAGLPWDAARNYAAKQALELGYNLAFLDDDMRVPPDAYIKLQQTGLDLIAGLYYQRIYPHLPVCFNQGKDDQGNMGRVPVQGWKPGEIFPATFIPSGLTLYTRRLLTVMFERYNSCPFYWGLDNAPLLDPSGNPVPPFSEDFTFSWRAQQQGFQGHVHSGVVGIHEVRAGIGPKWMVPEPGADALYGVCGVV